MPPPSQGQALAGTLVQRLATHKRRQFADEKAWRRHLERLGIADLAVTPDRVRVATEGALWGAVNAHGFLCDALVVSDDAGQFNVGQHALCWIHAERLVHKLETFTDQQRVAQQHLRGLIWWFYADLKAYRLAPRRRRHREMRARFDRIFQRRTGFVTLDRLLQRLHANKDELLMVLDHPEIPLHTNGSENDIRCRVTKRHITAEPTATSVATAATHSSGSPRHAGSSASRFGIILAPGSASAAVHSSRSFQTSSAAADSPPAATGSPGYAPITRTYSKHLE